MSAADDYLADSHRDFDPNLPLFFASPPLSPRVSSSNASTNVNNNTNKAKKLCTMCQQMQTRGASMTFADGSKVWLCKPCAIIKLDEINVSKSSASAPAVTAPKALLQSRGSGGAGGAGGAAAMGANASSDPALVALHRKAVKAIADKKYELGRDTLLTVIAHDPQDCTAMYNVACCEALLGNVIEASEHLERALSTGYANFEQVYGDPDLSSVRRLPTFVTLMQRHDPTFDGEQFVVAVQKTNLYTTLPSVDSLRPSRAMSPEPARRALSPEPARRALSPERRPLSPELARSPNMAHRAMPADNRRARTGAYAASTNVESVASTPSYTDAPPASPLQSLNSAKSSVYSSIGAALALNSEEPKGVYGSFPAANTGVYAGFPSSTLEQKIQQQQIVYSGLPDQALAAVASKKPMPPLPTKEQ